MFNNSTVTNLFKTSSTIKSQASITAEWNLNIAENIDVIGNYYYRPGIASPTEANFGVIQDDWAIETSISASKYYYGATDADVVIDGGYDENDAPLSFTSKNINNRLLFSLEDCFNRFRPRSGINKLVYFDKKYMFPNSGPEMFQRPRFYVPDKKDVFKYWTSLRTQVSGTDTVWQGMSKNKSGINYITDSAPFVVYKNKIPTNRIIIKMQTKVGSIDLSKNFQIKNGTSLVDPFYGSANKANPLKWKVQALQGTKWVDIWTQVWTTPSDIVTTDGYVELQYGITNIPSAYATNFVYATEYSSISALPSQSIIGYAYLVRSSSTSVGQYYIWNGTSYDAPFTPTYGWYLGTAQQTAKTPFVKELDTDTTPSYVSGTDTIYREFQYVNGLRIVVETMTIPEATFDLIELSPRLAVDITDRTVDYSIKKSSSDIGISGLPVGQILAAVGDIKIFDYDNSFNISNTKSILNIKNTSNEIVSSFAFKNLQIKLYDIVYDTDENSYHIPIKVMYSQGFPSTDNKTRMISLSLRDLFFLFESLIAPEILLPEASLSFAVSVLMDSIGFSNYSFKRNKNEKQEPIIPYFFIGPNTTVAEVLQNLAISTQTAVFLDEYNNLIFMSKNYLLPESEDERPTDFVFYGSADSQRNYVYENQLIDSNLSNIASIDSSKSNIYNDGKIKYSSRYIQKSVSSLKQASFLEESRNYVYKPVLLWEVAPTASTKSVNDEVGNQSAYSLSAIPLKTELTSLLPYVDSNGNIQNNIIDFGESIHWLSKYNGYFYANGEIIKYDAVEYSVPSKKTTGLIATLATGTAQITLTTGSTATLSIGQKLVKVSGAGAFNASGVTIKSITSDTVFTVTGNHATSGSITFEAAASNTNQWLSNVQEYQKYFAQIPFNGKMYPTGRIRIYTEPYYTSSGTIDKSIVYVENGTSKNGAVAKHGRAQFGTTIVQHSAGIFEDNSYWTNQDNIKACYMQSKYALNQGSSSSNLVLDTSAGLITDPSKKASTTGLIKNILMETYPKETDINLAKSVLPGTVQSSALVMSGASLTNTTNPVDYVSYIHKKLDNRYVHFGTRLRIIGQVAAKKTDSDGLIQNPLGASPYFVATDVETSTNINVSGASGGIAVLLDPTTNNGYYFEIIALTDNSASDYGLNNVIFYKLARSTSAPTGSFQALPVQLWSGSTSVIVDDGNFVGQNRVTGEENPSVYDLAVEYKKQADGSLRFYLYVNNMLIATVEDNAPLKIKDNVALFVRGSSKIMFENLYALSNNYAIDSSSLIDVPLNSVFTEGVQSHAGRRYAVSGAIQKTFLSGISTGSIPQYNIYFEEFGTIMREMAYFNIKYDKAYPALYAKISPTFNKLQGYTVSGFRANSYGAEFLLFNNTDSILNLDETSGNYLRIQGVTFTQESNNELTVDEYLSQKGDLSNPEFVSGKTDALKLNKTYANIKANRITNGKNEFSFEAPYIQSQDAANELMGWLISKIMKPRNSIGMKIFATPILQLGDIVKIDYINKDGDREFDIDSRFIVYYIEYARSLNGPSMNVYLSEVT
jgi:hypothetical protein